MNPGHGDVHARVRQRVHAIVAEVLAVHSVRPIAIDRAEAWRRADACLARGHSPVPIGIREFEDGFVAWPASGSDQPDFLLVIDRRSGALTRWPRLPLETLAREYRNHLAARTTNGTRPPQH